MIFEFDKFEFDAGRRELRRSGALVEVQPKVLDLLITLVRQRGRWVTREEILQTVWPGIFVSDHALAQVLHKLRFALDDEKRPERIIETRRGKGLRFAAPVVERGSGPASGPNTSADALRSLGAEPVLLLEREGVLGEAEEALRRAMSGRQQFVLVSGEAGIGKTTLLGALAVRALEQGFRVTVGRALPGSGAPAFAPWTRVLGELLEAWTPDGLAIALGPSAGYLTQAAPELVDILPSIAALPMLDPEHSRFRCFQAVASLLREASKQQPLLLMLEDLHWGDASSLLLVQFLAQHMKHTSSVLVLTFRGEEVVAVPALEQTLAALHRVPDVVEIRLEGLSRKSVEFLVEQTIGRNMSAALMDMLYRRTGGNPFFVTQYASLLDREGGIQTTGETDLTRLMQALPSGVLAAASRRVAYVSPACHEMLRFTALIVGDADFEILVRSGGLSESATLAALEEAVHAAVLCELSDVPGRFRFQHDLIRDALSAELSVVRRAEMHRLIGEAIEGAYAENLTPHLSSLAYHYVEAAAVGSRERALHFAELAGRRALESLHFEEAAQQFGRALAVLDAGVLATPERRVDLLLARGETLVGAANFAEARDVFARAAELARQQGDARRFARAALGYATKPIWPDWRAPVPLLEEGLSLLGPEDADLRVRLEIRLAEWSTFDPAARESAIALLASAARQAERSGDHEVLCDALIAHCRTLDFLASVDRSERLGYADRALAVAEQAGDELRTMIALFRGLRPLLEQGDFAAADARFERFVSLADRMNLVDWSWQAPLYRAMRLEVTGCFDAAERALANMDLAGRPEGALERPDTLRVPNTNALLFTLRRERGLQNVAPTTVATFRWFADATIIRAAVSVQLAELGQLEPARAILDRLAEHDFREIRIWPDPICAAITLVQTCRLLGDAKRAARLYEMLLPHESTWVVVLENAVCLGPVHHHLGSAATTTGDFAAAERHLKTAEAMAEAVGAAPWLARARYQRAQVLLLRGAPGDQQEAAELLDVAEAMAREIGLLPLVMLLRKPPRSDASS